MLAVEEPPLPMMLGSSEPASMLAGEHPPSPLPMMLGSSPMMLGALSMMLGALSMMLGSSEPAAIRRRPPPPLIP